MTWMDRPKDYRHAVIGALLGMLIASPIAVVSASESSTIMRYFILAAGFLIGFFGGRWVGSR